MLRNFCADITVVHKKTCHSIFVNNFEKCWPILKMFSLWTQSQICTKAELLVDEWHLNFPPDLKCVTTLATL